MEKVELHELTVTAPNDEAVVPLANAIRTMLREFHKQEDFEIVIPLELLKQAEATKRIFNIVLGSIAAISLLVGGIGIMNIMLASVTERTREIGIRRALGATRSDIILQFLAEALLLSVAGGMVGVGLGVAIPKIVTHFAKLTTIIQPNSLFLAFGISLLTGVVFGIYPAMRAAALSPIDALRHE
jgi:putative ABC transport system permease protein